MCGIFGIMHQKGHEVDIPIVIQALNTIRHRGPDDEGFAFFHQETDDFWQYGGKDTPESVYRVDLNYTPHMPYSGQMHKGVSLALGHRRLSIIDLSPRGHQPMCTPDGRYWIVYNGEIYNYLELKEELIREGHSFQSNSDTEVLLNAYVYWGTAALNRLIGMFAFAIYDREKHEIFLTRDFFGIKPLYYTSWIDGFAFASEIKALLCLPHLKKTINPQRAYEYLRLGHIDHGSDTLFASVQQVPPAHYMHLYLDRYENIQPLRYWDIDLDQRVQISFIDASKKIREIFLKNIGLHMRSDVPVGAALSGGIDSSSIVTSMRYLIGSRLDIHTFSYIADDPRVSEENWVDMVIQSVGVSEHKAQISPHQLTADMNQLILTQDEPFIGTTVYAQKRVMQLAKENNIKVLLDGQGADELLGGYPGHWGARLGSLIRQVKWFKACRFLKNIAYNEGGHWSTPFFRAMKFFLPSYLQFYAFKTIGRDLTPQWLRKKWFEDRQVEFIPQRMRRSANNEILREELYRSLMLEGLVYLLRYGDRNSMACSIESRVPFLTPEFTNFIFSLPEEYIIDSSGTSKSVFREAMRGIVPDVILSRRDKVGFVTPERKWLQTLHPWVESILSSEITHDIPLLDVPSIERRWGKILKNSHERFDLTVWSCINFIRWVELYDVSF